MFLIFTIQVSLRSKGDDKAMVGVSMDTAAVGMNQMNVQQNTLR